MPHALRPARRRRASTWTSSPSTIGAPVALIGVGPGRDQVIWTEAGRQTLVGEALAASASPTGPLADCSQTASQAREQPARLIHMLCLARFHNFLSRAADALNVGPV